MDVDNVKGIADVNGTEVVQEAMKMGKFMITWRIENFSFASVMKNGGITSSWVMAPNLGNSEWTLQIYPKGKLCNEGYTSCHLKNWTRVLTHQPLDVIFKFKLLTSDNFTIAETNYCSNRFHQYRKHGINQVIPAKDLEQVMKCAKEDVLIVQCRILYKSNIEAFMECWPTTVIGTNTYTFQWQVKYSDDPVNFDQTLITLNHFLRVRIYWIESEDDVEISVSTDCGENFLFYVVTLEINLLTQTGDKLPITRRLTHILKSLQGTWAFPNLMKKSLLQSEKEKYIRDGKINMNFKFSIFNNTTSFDMGYI